MAKDVNKWTGIGRAGSDAEIINLPNGGMLAKVNIACQDDYNDKNTGQKVEQTDWIRLTVFGKRAEPFAKYVKKGKQIWVEGKLKPSKYADKDTGKDVHTWDVQVNDFQLLGGRDDNAGSGQAPQQSAAPAQQGNAGGTPAVGGGSFDDDIPFAPFMNGTFA